MILRTILVLLVLVSSNALAQTPCGVGGTALSASGATVTRTDEQATKDNVRVGPDGYWWQCPKPKAPSVNLDCRLSGGALPSWYGEDGTRCVANEIIRGPKRHGEQITMMATRRGVIGYQRMQCDDGILVSRYKWCRRR